MEVSKQKPCQHIEQPIHQVDVHPIEHYAVNHLGSIGWMGQQAHGLEVEAQCSLQLFESGLALQGLLLGEIVHIFFDGPLCLLPKARYVGFEA